MDGKFRNCYDNIVNEITKAYIGTLTNEDVVYFKVSEINNKALKILFADDTYKLSPTASNPVR